MKFTMVDEEGTEQEVEVLGSLELENQHYIAVAYLEELEDKERKGKRGSRYILSAGQRE